MKPMATIAHDQNRPLFRHLPEALDYPPLAMQSKPSGGLHFQRMIEQDEAERIGRLKKQRQDAFSRWLCEPHNVGNGTVAAILLCSGVPSVLALILWMMAK